MRFSRLLAAAAVLAIVGAGCDDATKILSPEKLAPPLGLTSITGDRSVLLTWEASNYGEGRDGFRIYKATGTQSGTPEDIPAAFGTTFIDVPETDEAGSFTYSVGDLANGTTFSFLVVAYKGDTDVSRPSNIVQDTPRRETAAPITLVTGANSFLDVQVSNPAGGPDNSNADVRAQSFNAGAGDRAGLVAVHGARIQDKGFASNWDEVDKAPLNETSYPSGEFSVQALAGHVYVVRTSDNHYAKLWVHTVNDNTFSVTMDVAYQTQDGSNELKPGDPRR